MATDTEPLRLVKSYRGYGVGAVIHATRRLAEQLVADGYAVRDHQTTFLEHQTAERAVATEPAVEKR
jgi:hypothetical protein